MLNNFIIFTSAVLTLFIISFTISYGWELGFLMAIAGRVVG